MKEFEIAFPLRHQPAEAELRQAAGRALGVKPERVAAVRIVRRSLDARGEILYRYRVQAAAMGETLEEYKVPAYQDVHAAEPVLIIGSGPAGMFAALRLLMEGRRPVILERGKDVHARKVDVAALNQRQCVNGDSNYCFGEGGAGTFSDGKLYTRSSKRGDLREVLQLLVAFGAADSILADAHPHIGSDALPRIVERIRQCIVEHGGAYHFGEKVTGLVPVSDGLRHGWKVTCAGGASYSARQVILATGHSSRDIYRYFAAQGWPLEAKGFALGVRAEHPQTLINQIQYHGKFQPGMPAAEYSLVEQVDGRGVFSFCMCPGGILVPSVTGPGEVVLNGMSNSMRNSLWANAGIVCAVNPGDVPDFDRYGVFSLLAFQESVERAMFSFSNSLRAPAQRLVDFCRKKPSQGLPRSSYQPGAINAPLCDLLPEGVFERLRVAFAAFDRKMHGYYTNEALVLGVESRTSSPVRIPRDPETMCVPGLEGLYPCGEGAGYAGGITSSALDGILVAAAAAAR